LLIISHAEVISQFGNRITMATGLLHEHKATPWRIVPPRRRLRRLNRALLGTVLAVLCLWLILPYDSPLRLAIRWNGRRLLAAIGPPWAEKEADWLLAPPRFPIDLFKDVAVISKTGYGTQHRMQEQLLALDVPGGIDLERNLLVIADFATSFGNGSVRIEAHNVVEMAVEMHLRQDLEQAERVLKYRDLANAINKGDNKFAWELSKQFGWELDAMKFVPGLELAYKTMPERKWYVMIDDDSYLLQHSLPVLLGHLDPDAPHYVGNAVGDYKRRFAHGGSTFMLSRAAMHRLFRNNRQLLPAAYEEALDETWGDRLIAALFMKMGIYLDERFSHFFNGEPPERTMIRRDRICSPLISFHELKTPDEMKRVGDKFRNVGHVFRWGAVWDMYAKATIEDFALRTATRSTEARADFVGVTDSSTLFKTGVETFEPCRDACLARGATCLAWTWIEIHEECHHSDWMIVGNQSETQRRKEQFRRRQSGINANEAWKAYKECNAR
jgi:hypothetical protein